MNKSRRNMNKRCDKEDVKSNTSKRRNSKKYSNKDEKSSGMEVAAEYPSRNDSSWYYTDKVLMDQVSSFSFNQYLGNDGAFLDSGALQSYQVPTVMRVLLNPSPGFSHIATNGFSGINQAGMKIYTTLSSGNSKNTLYAPQDVTTLLLALGEVLSMSEVARRALGVAFTYNKRNWVYPKGIIRACGFDADDLLKNLAQYRIWFNTVVNQINKIAFPANIKYFEKCINLYSGIYLDSESPMAQSIVFLPYSTWNIDETSYSGGTILKTIGAFNNVTSFDVMSLYLAKLEVQIDNILSSATFNYIYSDVLRLFGDGGLYTVPYIDESYVVVPEYNPMMLLQLDNATVCNVPNASAVDLTRGITPSNDVYPDVGNNRLLYMPQFGAQVTAVDDPSVWADAFIINYPHSMGNPDVDQKVESTRLAARFNWEVDSGGPIITGGALPDHYVTVIGIFENDLTTSALSIGLSYVKEANVTASLALGYSKLSKFERAPRLYIQGATSPYDTSYITGDLDYFTTIDFNYLDRVNQLSYVSLFEVR